MNNPRKIKSDIITNLRKKRNPLESQRTRTSMSLAARISNRLKELGMSKIQFAEKIGKKPSAISRWLSGTHNFTSFTLSDIQEILKINLFNYSAGKDNVITVSSSDKIIVNVFNNIEPSRYLEELEISSQSSAEGMQIIETCDYKLN